MSRPTPLPARPEEDAAALESRHDLGGLATWAWRPTGAPRAVLVVRTPYGAEAHRAEGAGWAAHGLALVVQDVRGRHGSDGDFTPYAGEAADGLRLLDWVGRRWEAPVVLHGASYAAHCAVETARAAADRGAALAGVSLAVPALGLGETARTRDDVLCLESRLGWWSEHAHRRGGEPPAADVTLRHLARHLPVRDLDAAARAAGVALPSWSRVVAARRDDDRLAALGALEAPLLVIGGLRDFFAQDAVDVAGAWGGPSLLVLGPWAHDLRGSARARRTLDWLDAVLPDPAREDRRAHRPAGVHLVDARGGVEELASWPMPARSVRLRGGSFPADPDDPHPSPPLGSRVLPAGRVDRLVLALPAGLGGPRGLVGEVAVTVHAGAATPDGATTGATTTGADPEQEHWCVSLALRERTPAPAPARGAAAPPAPTAPPAPPATDPTTATTDPTTDPGVRLLEVAHGAAVGPRVRLGPVAVPADDVDRLVLVVSAHSFPRHARDLQTGEDALAGATTRVLRRRVHSIDLEVPA
ncbi:CocE/NonD family hydrolase [Nocardioides kribbensis]|uniref:CocE/NonD family hydrolase n=1 Tax=Nocardioides kribbensis TaxID=305517 RepID=UPI0032DB65B9